MDRHLVSLAGAFLLGALAGAVAVGGWIAAPAPAESPALEGSPGTGDAAMAEHSGRALATTVAPEPVTSGDAPVSPLAGASQGQVAGESDEDARLREITAGWTRLQEAIMRLDGRVSDLEKRLGGSEAADAGPPERPATAEDRRSVLTGAGVAEDLAADIVWREAQYELDRLELRDLAIREGWFRSDRYREELARVEREKPDLRTEIGDDVFDRYLFGAGEDNRVRISSVIAGSSAETAGLNPGDLIERYDGNRVFSFTELREATTGGDRGELVPVEIRRADGRRDQLWLPRGPLGVRMDLIRTDPDA